jgi:hypothetical protein
MKIDRWEFPVVEQGIVKLDKNDFNKILNISQCQLPNTDMYETVAQFKMKTVDGIWLLFDIIKVDGEDELQTGVNIFINQIELVDSYESK